MSSFPSVTLEIAFASDPIAPSPNYVDCTDALIEFELTRGRMHELDQVQAGHLSLTLDNSDRRFDPAYTLSSFYPNVVPMRKVRLSATFGGTTYYLFTGFVSDWTPEFSRPNYGQTTVIASDAFEALGQAAITGTFPQEASGARIARVIEAIGWPSSTAAPGGFWKLGVSKLGTETVLGYGIPSSVLDPGREMIPGVTYVDTDNVMALNHLLDVTDSELGAFFIDGQGRFIFHDRHNRLKRTSSVTFTDGTTGSATRINYADIVPRLDRERLVNDVKISRSGGTTYAASDPGSVGQFLRRTFSRSPLVVDDTRSKLMGDFIISTRKTPSPRFDSIMVEGHFDDNAWPHVLGREISDRVTVEYTQPSVPSVPTEQTVRDCYIESVTHRVQSPVLWETTYQLSAVLPTQPYWVLGVSKLGIETRLAY